MTQSVAELTRRLVSIPSHENEIEAGDFLERWLRRETDAGVSRDEVGNVIARKPVREDEANARTLAFVGHHDVVPPDESQLANGEYLLEERDGRLYGRGTADMKGALAAAAIAFREWTPPATAETESPVELVFASFVGEERGGTGARHAIENEFSPDYAVVGEGSTNYSGNGVTDVAVAHKGRRASTITARGTTAHASEPNAGENAVYRGADAVTELQSLETPSREVAGEQLDGTLAVTEIEGGTAWNVVPDRCTITVDERTVPGERAALESVAKRNGVEWTVDQDLPPMACTDEAFASAVLAAADETQPASPEFVTKPHATDAGWLSQAGTECVIYGAAEPGQAHTETESVSIAVLERCLETYRRLATVWLEGGFER